MDEKEKIVELEAYIKKLKMDLEGMNSANLQLEKENEELQGRIKFLEGQIDAYQYCTDCMSQFVEGGIQK